MVRKENYRDMSEEILWVPDYIRDSYSVGVNPLPFLRKTFPEATWKFYKVGKGPKDGSVPSFTIMTEFGSVCCWL